MRFRWFFLSFISSVIRAIDVCLRSALFFPSLAFEDASEQLAVS